MYVCGLHSELMMEDKLVMTRMQSVGQDSSSSEDSSYDSDFGGYSEDSTHCDVSRTVSDTLAQEFSEYISTNVKDDSNYTAKVDFARKLGYSEDQVKIALGKLGQSASQNELLAELIQLDVGSKGGAAGGLPTPPVILLQPAGQPSKLRHIVIDGSNVAMSHGSNKIFSSRGIKIAVEYFRARGHQEITVFVPMYRKENCPDDPVSDHKILTELESEGTLVWTPSKKINNRRLVCYDDRYILKLAVETDGVVVSNDNYRDLTIESPDFKRVVEERTLMYSFVNDRFMPPEDPLGRHGPTLDQFLMENTTPRTAKQIPCPYGRKCTFGTKCKYYHITQKVSVSETLRKQAAMKTTSLPILHHDNIVKLTCTRTKSAIINSNSTSLQLQPQAAALSSSPCSSSSGDLNNGNSSNSSSSHHGLASSLNYQKSVLTNSQSCGPSGVNGHRKLQRVPSVNPYFLSSQPQQSISNQLHPPPSSSSHHHQQQQQQLTHSHSMSGGGGGQASMESRNQTFHNLAAIFPEEKVKLVMNTYPYENDPQVICRLILDTCK